MQLKRVFKNQYHYNQAIRPFPLNPEMVCYWFQIYDA